MKKITLIFCIAILTFITGPQLFSKFNGGIKAGINLTNLSIHIPYKSMAGSGGFFILDDNYTRKVGLTIGGFYSFKLNKNFFIQPELYFSQKKYRSEYSTIAYRYETDTYIELPLLIKYKKSIFEVFAGPYFAYLLDADGYLEFTAGTQKLIEELDKEDIEPKDTEFGLVFGAGFRWNRFILDVRYTLGLTKFTEDLLTMNKYTNTRTTKHNAIVILLGIEF